MSDPTTRVSPRKRKAQRIVESSEEEEEYEKPVDGMETSPKMPAAVIKSKAITRGKRKAPAPPTDKETPAAGSIEPEITGSTTPALPADPPEPPGEKTKAKETTVSGERPTKRQKLPSMRRAVATPGASTTPLGGNTPTVEKIVPLPKPTVVGQRQIVDAPLTNDVDLRDEDAFAKLFKKTGTGKSDTRYDMTSTERMEHKKAELAALREEYIAQKARDKKSPFDLGAQNRKLYEMQHTLEDRGSRVCVNVVGSCILTVHKDWLKLLAEQTQGSSSPP